MVLVSVQGKRAHHSMLLTAQNLLFHSAQFKLNEGQWTGGLGSISRELSSFLWSSINSNGAAPDSSLHPQENQQDNESCKSTADLKVKSLQTKSCICSRLDQLYHILDHC